MARPIAKIRILDEVSCVIVGLHGSHLEQLINNYAIKEPGYFFSSLYKLGRWDGRKKFVHANGKTFVYLLDGMLPLITSWGYSLQLEDLRRSIAYEPKPVHKDTFIEIPHPKTGNPIEYRWYQIDAVNKLVEHGNGIVVAATSAGKTLMCAGLCDTYNQEGCKTLTIVPDAGLIAQTKATYIHCKLDTGEYSGDIKDLNHAHVVSTWQALQHNPKIVELFQVVIIDECHGAKASVLNEILVSHAFNIPHRFGFTGTLPKEESDKMTVFTAIGPVRYEIPAHILIAEGVLAAPSIDVFQLEEDFTAEYEQYKLDLIGSPEKLLTYAQFKDSYFPDYSAEKSYMYRNEDRIDWIAEMIMIKADQKKGNVLCLVDSIPYGRQIAARIPNAIFVNGQDMKKPKKRQEVYDLFDHHDNLVVIGTVHVVGTGISIDRIFNLVMVDMGKSFTRIIQGIGRSLRTSADKTSVNISDICSDLKYGKKHLKTRTDYYKEAQYPFKKHKVKYIQVA